ncbi:MAG: ABC transporter permease [Lachnospiraceae bacterium]|nr:ABC transporter permease [Lachnospiraceae bacterium]
MSIFLSVAVAILLVIIVLPAIIIIPEAFTALNYFTFPVMEFSMKWFDKFWSNVQWIQGLGRSVFLAVVSGIIATVIGTMAALAMQKLGFRLKGGFMMLMVAPMIIPVVIIGASMYTVLAPLGLTNTLFGIALAHILLGIPMVFITMSSALSGLNPNLELASMSMGASPVVTFLKVVMPSVKAPLIASFLFAFVTSMDEVAATLFLSGANTKTLTIVMWENMRTAIEPTIAVAATFLIILTLGVYILKEIGEIRSMKKYS